MKKKKLIIAILIVVAIAGSALAIRAYLHQRGVDAIERQRAIDFANEHLQKEFYVSRMRLRRNMPLWFHDSYGQQILREIVFVDSWHEIANFGDDVAVVYPSFRTYIVLDSVNFFLTNPEEYSYLKRQEFTLNLEDYGLTYPITVYDVIHNWRSVFDVEIHLGNIYGEAVLHHASDSYHQVRQEEFDTLSAAIAERGLSRPGLELPVTLEYFRRSSAVRLIILNLFLEELRGEIEIPAVIDLFVGWDRGGEPLPNPQ